MKATWIALGCSCLLLACSQEEDKPTPKKAEPAEKPAEKPAAKTPPPEKPAEPPAPSVDLDCDALLTADDVKKACKSKVTWQADAQETGAGPTYCSRKAGGGGQRMQFQVGVHPEEKSASAASGGVDSGAYKRETTGGGGMKGTKVYGRKGVITVSVSTQVMGSAKSLCKDAQLEELAKLVHQRLP